MSLALASSILLAGGPAAAQPELAYSTYLGAPANDFAHDVAFDDKGNAYVVGCTQDPPILDFPFVLPPANFFDGGAGLGQYDAFVTKLSPAGEVVYSAVLGGPEGDCAYGVAVDADDRAIVAGHAGAMFPLVDPIESYQTTPDVFVAILDPTGTELEFSTYLSGAESDFGADVAVDAQGALYVTGSTSSDENTFLPTSPTFDATANGGSDGFLAKIDPAAALGPQIVYKTFLGTPGTDSARAVALDGSRNVYLVGNTDWPDPFDNAPVPMLQSMHGGGYDAFLLRINSGGFGSAFFTWLGGSSDEDAWDVALNPSGEILIAGGTDSTGFPTEEPLQPFRGVRDAFLARIAPAGDTLRSSTFWGGSMVDQGWTLAVTPSGDVLLAGQSNSFNLTVTGDRLQQNHAGGHDVFVTRFSPEIDEVLFSTWLGGSDLDVPYGAAFHGGRLAVAGSTNSTGGGAFPVTDDAVIGSAPTPYNGFFSVIAFEPVDPGGETHPADQDGDWRIELDEVTAYGAAWKNGAPWPVPPSPILIDYVTNAAAIWKKGEAYVDTGETKPGGWQPVP